MFNNAHGCRGTPPDPVALDCAQHASRPLERLPLLLQKLRLFKDYGGTVRTAFGPQNSTARSLALMFLLAALTGCESFATHYDFQGRVLLPSGLPATGIKVYVIDVDWASKMDDTGHWSYWTTWGDTTEQSGKFRGTFNAEPFYRQWMWSPPPAPAKEVQGVYVWMLRQCKWSQPIFVSGRGIKQQHGYPGGRHLDLPDLIFQPSEADKGTGSR
jgi:hypothetical protein